MSNGSRVRAVVQDLHRVCVLELRALEGRFEVIFCEAYRVEIWLVGGWLYYVLASRELVRAWCRHTL